ncbi:MAG: class I SAM-dependent methyltransferase [Hydrogenophaga sp.]|nr:class I SAM-dependent methyltransferase [Hydrogenophaga sp.]
MDKAKSQAFMMKVVADLAAATTVSLVHVGDRVGLFRAMAGAGPMSREALEQRTGIHPRYLEEWLAAMFCAGYVEHDADADTWQLPDEHAVFFADPGQEHYLGGLFKGAPALAAMAPRVAEAFETGQGIPFQAYGEAGPLAIEHMNRAVYEARLVTHWLPALPQVLQRLQAGGSALDVGCGTGVIPILLARAFPAARVTGLDVDARSIEIARENARQAGVQERVQFVHQSAVALEPQGDGYDLISTFDVVHDLPDPDAVLRRIRDALSPGGTYLMVEPKVAERLQDNAANPFARMLYGISCLHCVPTSLAQGGPGWSACWGETRARLAAQEAGFGSFKVLPIRNPTQAFFELAA